MKNKTLLLMIIIIVFVSGFIVITKRPDLFKKSKYDYFVLVNKYSQLPDDWEKNVELVDAKNAWKEDIKIEKNAYKNYKKLKKELKGEGIEILLDSVYRSVEEQQNLWDEWSKDPEKGIDYVRKYVAVPGYSEHHTGLAVDICIKKDGKLIYDNDEMIAERKIFKKIHSKLAKYGFILRYLENRDEITGYSYEPWHLRYIGNKKVAKEIMEKDITFEEYLDSVTDLKKNNSAAKYKIEKALQEKLNKDLEGKITNSRFNITKIYSDKEVNNNETIKSLKFGDKDIAFEVTYQLQPAEGVDPNELMVVDGKYDEELEWVVDLHRLGILRYKNGKYTIDNFGTGW